MRNDMRHNDRRRFLKLMLAVPAMYALGPKLIGRDEAAIADELLAASTPGSKSAGRTLPVTPDCDDGDEPTPAMTEGPFFTPRSPLRASLVEPGMAGTRIALSGRVFTRNCEPVAKALLDFWHADDAGEYDNEGYRLRGHVFADDEGRWKLETIVPGLYPGRTRHFHLKVQAPGGRILTTQLYFPNEPKNNRDGIFDPRLLLSINDAKTGKEGRFNFVLRASSAS
jgi:protocatechuate 3,4-dioxygenase beta subunit